MPTPFSQWLKNSRTNPTTSNLRVPLHGENGLNLTKKIKEVYPDIIIFILTNYDIPEYRKAAVRYGTGHFVVKESFDRMRLEELVRSYYKI